MRALSWGTPAVQQHAADAVEPSGRGTHTSPRLLISLQDDAVLEPKHLGVCPSQSSLCVQELEGRVRVGLGR